MTIGIILDPNLSFRIAAVQLRAYADRLDKLSDADGAEAPAARETLDDGAPVPAKKRGRPAKVAAPVEVEVETEEEADPFGEPEAEDAAEPEVTTQMVMAAAKKYDTKNGREKMLKILGRFLPAGKKSINDVPSDQLAACLKAFGG